MAGEFLMGNMLLEQGFLLQKQNKEIKELNAKIKVAEMKLIQEKRITEELKSTLSAIRNLTERQESKHERERIFIRNKCGFEG